MDGVSHGCTKRDQRSRNCGALARRQRLQTAPGTDHGDELSCMTKLRVKVEDLRKRLNDLIFRGGEGDQISLQLLFAAGLHILQPWPSMLAYKIWLWTDSTCRQRLQTAPGTDHDELA